MTDYLNFRWNIWKKKDFWFQQSMMPIISKYCQTYLNIVICRQIQQTIQRTTKGVSAGVKRFDCGKVLNENAPTDCRGIFGAFGSYRDVVIPIVAKSMINFNNYARLHVSK